MIISLSVLVDHFHISGKTQKEVRVSSYRVPFATTSKNHMIENLQALLKPCVAKLLTDKRTHNKHKQR